MWIITGAERIPGEQAPIFVLPVMVIGVQDAAFAQQQANSCKMHKRHEVTGASRVIPQPTTNPADTCLTSRIERDGVC